MKNLFFPLTFCFGALVSALGFYYLILGVLVVIPLLVLPVGICLWVKANQLPISQLPRSIAHLENTFSKFQFKNEFFVDSRSAFEKKSPPLALDFFNPAWKGGKNGKRFKKTDLQHK